MQCLIKAFKIAEVVFEFSLFQRGFHQMITWNDGGVHLTKALRTCGMISVVASSTRLMRSIG